MGNGCLSVVFAVYNRAAYFSAMLSELLRQRERYPKTEVIVVDDGSTEDRRWLDDIPDIKVIHRWNGGASAARNTGMRAATGEYIVILDSDDMLMSNYLDVVYADMRAGYDWVSYKWTCDGNIDGARRTEEPLMVNCAAWAYAFRREITQGIWFDETMNIAEDQDWLHRVLRDDLKWKHSDEIIYDYRWNRNPGSVVHRHLSGQLGKTRKVMSESVTYKNVFFIANINSVGGIETMFWNMAKKYGKTHDITVFYKAGDIKQIERLKMLVRVKKYVPGVPIRCEKLFCNLNTDIIKDVDADEIYQIIHTDYQRQKIPFVPHPRTNHVISVSENCRKTLKEWAGVDSEVCYNPIVVEKPKRILHLISATRLTKEKGAERMKILAGALKEAGIPYDWKVFTDIPGALAGTDIKCYPVTLDINDWIADADYLVQLSDCEGWPYSILESLCVGTPVIVTDFPVVHELGIENGVNGWILPMGMANIPVKEIYKGIKRFSYTPKADRWNELLAEGKGDYDEEMKKMVDVVCQKPYFDIELQCNIKHGQELHVTRARGEHLVDAGVCVFKED